MRRIFAFPALVVACLALTAQNSAQPAAQPTGQIDPPNREWHAAWTTHPTAPLKEPVVLHFRHGLALGAVPASYVVRVSADNRFVLYVNGRRVGDGPARGDVNHWRYEKFDLAPLLKAGDNLITATVWNFGVYAPIAQMTARTAFLLESEATGAEGISTPEGWLVEVEPGQRVVPRVPEKVMEYMASGTGEELDAARYDWAWNGAEAKGAAWVTPISPFREDILKGVERGHSAGIFGDNPWELTPDRLPHMEYTAVTAGSAVRADTAELKAFPEAPVTVAAGSHVHLMLDRKTLTTAYPLLTVSGGKGAQVRLVYAEALYDKDDHKGDRDEVEGRTAHGITDRFLPDGGAHRVFEPLWWRTWRYLDLEITTGAEPLELEGLTAHFTAYPFEERATLKTPEAELDKIWEISWRTARLDAHETYMDTPYWEQLQYVGDTRIQALISYTVAGDDRLGRQALEAFDESRIPEGITQSRYPSELAQFIPTFSLLYVGMVHDYWMYRPDADEARKLLPGTRSVLEWYADHTDADGLLHRLPWWSFVDWVSSGEIPTYDAQDESCATTLEYLGALGEAADLEKGLGKSALTARYEERGRQVREGIYGKCWSAERGLVADNADQKNFSQQSNILAVLYDVIPKEKQQDVLRRMLEINPGDVRADGVLSASHYFRFYLARALEHAGLADEYLNAIGPWRKLLPLHFSTWPEIPGNTRSDSHAWTAHPIYDLLTLVAGIEPASAGFKTVRIAPHLGMLPSLTATFPHPEGEIKVDYVRKGAGLDATITLPGRLSGSFVYGGREWALKAGVNRVEAR